MIRGFRVLCPAVRRSRSVASGMGNQRFHIPERSDEILPQAISRNAASNSRNALFCAEKIAVLKGDVNAFFSSFPSVFYKTQRI